MKKEELKNYIESQVKLLGNSDDFELALKYITRKSSEGYNASIAYGKVLALVDIWYKFATKKK